MRDMAGQQDLRAVLATAQTLTAEFNHRQTLLTSLAGFLASGVSPADVLANPAAAVFDGGAVVLQNGSLTLAGASGFFSRYSSADLAELVNSLPVATADQASAAWPYRLINDPADGQTYFVSSRAAGANGIFAAAFSASSLAAASMAGMHAGHLHSENLSARLLSQDGTLIYGLGAASSAANPAGSTGVSEALQGESGVTYMRQDGEEVVLAFTPVEPLGWALVTQEPWQAQADPLLKTTQILPLALVPALLLALLGLWWGARQVIQPLQNLRERAGKLSRGRYAPIEEPAGGIPEIQALQATLIDMSRKVQASQDNMRSYLGAVTTGQEEERRRLAREIHDDTLQAVIALNRARPACPSEPPRWACQRIPGRYPAPGRKCHFQPAPPDACPPAGLPGRTRAGCLPGNAGERKHM